MTESTHTLSLAQRDAIYRALTRRDGDFLAACFDAVCIGESIRADISEQFYEKLARREWSKLETLDNILASSGYPPMFWHQEGQGQYDINHLLSFEPTDHQRFVSMLIDFAAGRSPNPDEALHLEHLLLTGSASRLELLEFMVDRYSTSLVMTDGQVVRLISSHNQHTLCQWSRGLVNFHRSVCVVAALDKMNGTLEASEELLFSCDLPLRSDGEWRLDYDIENIDEGPIELAITDRSDDHEILRSRALRKLTGRQDFCVDSDKTVIKVSLSCPSASASNKARVKPVFLRLEQNP